MGVLPFALIHILHHGVLVVAGPYNFRLISGIIWFILMVGVSLFFAYIRKKSNSLYPAIVGHAVFNLVMNLTIFGFLL